MPPFAERTLATTECFDFGDQCTVLPTRNGDYGRSRGVGPGDSWRAMGHMPKSCSAARVLWKCARTPERADGSSFAVSDMIGTVHDGRIDAKGSFRDGRGVTLSWSKN